MARQSQTPEQLRAAEPAVLQALLSSRNAWKGQEIPFTVPYITLPRTNESGEPVFDGDGLPIHEPLHFACTPIDGATLDELNRKSTHGGQQDSHELNCRVVVAATVPADRAKWWANPAVHQALGVGETWRVVGELLKPGDVVKCAMEIMQASGYGPGAEVGRNKSAAIAGTDRNGRDA